MDKLGEKLQKYGLEILTDAELLSIILRTGAKNESALVTAEKLLTTFCTKGFLGLYHMSIEEMMRINGVGRAKAVEIKAVLEIAQRIAKTGALESFQVSSPESIAAYLMVEMKLLREEHFKALYLDGKNAVIAEKTISIGTATQSLIHPREVFREAVKLSAVSVVLAHNHPSGDATPSREDLLATQRIIEGGSILGIHVLDHIVIAGNDYVSMKEMKIM